MRYRSLDGLRGLAAYTVLIAHYGNQTTMLGAITPGAGQLGVMLFFTLSGFLMGRLYLDAPPTLWSIADFFRKRVARVFPLYLIVVAVSFFLTVGRGTSWPFFPIGVDEIWEHLLFRKGESVLWTIPVEVKFYLFFPIFWLLYRIEAKLLWILIAVFVAAFMMWENPPAIMLAPFATFFLLGLAVSMLPAFENAMLADFLFVVLLLGYFIAFPRIGAHLGLEFGNIWLSPLYMLFVPALLTFALNSTLADRALGCSPSRFAGDISYSLYLLHLPVMYALYRLYPHWDLIGLTIFLASATAVAFISYRFIETPLRRLLAGRLSVSVGLTAFRKSPDTGNAEAPSASR